MKPWKDLRWQNKNHKKYVCRCNKRSCQARVTRKKHPEEYKIKKYSMCPYYPNCNGKLYVDWFRMWKDNSSKDRGEVCNCNGRIGKHRKGQVGCIYRDDYIIENSLKPKPKHYPFKNEEYEEPPF